MQDKGLKPESVYSGDHIELRTHCSGTVNSNTGSDFQQNPFDGNV